LAQRKASSISNNIPLILSRKRSSTNSLADVALLNLKGNNEDVSEKDFEYFTYSIYLFR
jgi:hypothetical protein